MNLYVTANKATADFTITDYSYNSIEVFFDNPASESFQIISNVICKLDNVVPENHKLGTEILSTDTLTINGPASIINKIESVNANIVVDSVLTQTTN